MPSHRMLWLLAAVPLLGACGSDGEPTAVSPSITVTPVSVMAGPPGSHTTATVDVRGIGAAPTITWESIPSGAIAIESMVDGGRSAVLRFDRPQAALVVVTARGTRTLSDTISVTIPALRTIE